MSLAARRSLIRVCAVASLVLPAAAAMAQEPQVVIALDSSRSLSAQQSRDSAALARELYVRLAATAQPSVLVFDDSARWLSGPGEPGAEAALDALQPSGRFTVLHDGLIEGVRALVDGGVLVLISDGKDENSATTIDDVARLASERGVRIAAFGAGRVDERTLRRLALLTDGFYGGVAAGADPDALAGEIEALRREVRAERAPAVEAAPPPAPVVVAPEPPAAVVPPPRQDSRLLLLLGALVAMVGIAVGFVLARRRTPARAGLDEELEPGTAPGVPMPESPPPYASEPDPIDEIQLARLRGRQPIAPGGLLEVSLDDTATFQSLPFSESIERTLVLTEEVVLSVREPGQEPRFYGMPAERAIDIGRDSTCNTLAFQDPTMSVQHLRVLLEENEVFLVDLGSTNGVIYQGRRVDSARLGPGDRFRAGMIEFELQLHRASTT